MLHAVLTAWEAGSGHSRFSTRIDRESLLDARRTLEARGCKCDNVVLLTRCLHETGEGPADVVADPGRRMRERRDVDDDSHRDS